MKFNTQESRIQTNPLPSSSPAVLSPLRAAKVRSNTKSTVFGLVAFSLFYVALQYEEIANLIAGESSRTPLQTIADHVNDNEEINDTLNADAMGYSLINSNISPQANSDNGASNNKNIDHAVPNGVINSSIPPQANSNDLIKNGRIDYNIPPQANANDAVENGRIKSNISPQVNSSDAVENGRIKSNIPPQVNSSDAVENGLNKSNIPPQVNSSDVVENVLNKSNIPPHANSSDIVENGLNKSNIPPQANLKDGEGDDKNYTNETNNNHNDTVHLKILPQSNSTPSLKLLPTDLIYQSERWANPIIIYEYKLIFYPIPKVACTDWKRLFRRMGGQPEWNTTGLQLKLLHDPLLNNLTTLPQLPIDEAQRILTSSEWTRAVFVREPKERILSAYLDKYVNNNKFFRKKCCQPKHNVTKKECKDRKNDNPELSYFLNRTRDCPNDHWDPQYSMIDTKWWNTINFVGYMHSVVEDSKRLLQSITFTEDGVSAWEKYGKTGWGENGTSAFMELTTAHHATNAHDKLRSFYTREDEKFVEKYWKGEWNHTIYHFTPLQLYKSNTTNANDGSEK